MQITARHPGLAQVSLFLGTIALCITEAFWDILGWYFKHSLKKFGYDGTREKKNLKTARNYEDIGFLKHYREMWAC